MGLSVNFLFCKGFHLWKIGLFEDVMHTSALALSAG